ncbi:uncharacterized protein METZ01_LOCUS381385, partial [marine metagenome]
AAVPRTRAPRRDGRRGPTVRDRLLLGARGDASARGLRRPV